MFYKLTCTLDELALCSGYRLHTLFHIPELKLDCIVTGRCLLNRL